MAGTLLLAGFAILAGIGLQSSTAFRWLLLPLLSRALGAAELRIDAGRLRLPARLELTGIEIRERSGRFALRAARLDLSLDVWGSQRSGRWIFDEIRTADLEVELGGASPAETEGASFDALAFEARRVELLRTRLVWSTAGGARTTLGPGTLALRDALRGARPGCQLTAPLRIVGSDRTEYEGHVALDLTGVLSSAAPHLAWEGSADVRLGPVAADAGADSGLELAGRLSGQLGRGMPTILAADLLGRQAGHAAGRVEGSLVRITSSADASLGEDGAWITAALGFTEVEASLLNPLLAFFGLDQLESGRWDADLKWDSGPGEEKLSSRIDVRDLRVRHATGVVGPFVLHSVQSATWNTEARTLEIERFELDLVMAGVPRIRGRLDRPLTLGAAQGAGTRARAEVVVDSLPLNGVSALGLSVPRQLWDGTLSGRVSLEVLESQDAGEYALDFTLSLPPAAKAPIPALRKLRRARLELAGRAALDSSVEIERMQLGLRSGGDPVLNLTGSGGYALAAHRIEMKGTLESRKLASIGLWGLLPAEWTRAASLDALEGSWQLALDSRGLVLRSDPRLFGLAFSGPSRSWSLGDARLALVVETSARAPLRIRELRARVPGLGKEAELRLTGDVDLRASPPASRLDLSWEAVSLVELRESKLLPDVPGFDRLRAGTLHGDLAIELESEARIRGTARLEEARVRVGPRDVGPLAASAELAATVARGKTSVLKAEIACASEVGPLLRLALRQAADPSTPSAYALKIGLLDLGQFRSLFDAGARAPGPILSGELHVSAQTDTTRFRFELAGAAPAKDRARGEGTLSGASTPALPRKIEARLDLERATLDPYLELFAVVSRAASERADPRSAPAEIELDAQVGVVTWRALVFEGGSFTWTLDRRGSRLALRPRRALGGDLTGEAMLARSGKDRPRLEWKLEGGALDAGALFRAFRGEGQGVLRGSLSIRSQGQLALGAGPHQGSGRTELEITDGQFGSSALLDFLATQTRISALRRMRFDTLAADLRLEGDTLQVVAVDVRSPVAGLAMTGAVDLSGHLDLRVLSRAGPALKELLGANEYSKIVGATIDRFLTLPVLVLVNGTLGTPTYSVRPTTGAMTTAVWETVSEAADLLRRGTRSVFQRPSSGPPPETSKE
jgi:hypothetical protein